MENITDYNNSAVASFLTGYLQGMARTCNDISEKKNILKTLIKVHTESPMLCSERWVEEWTAELNNI